MVDLKDVTRLQRRHKTSMMSHLITTKGWGRGRGHSQDLKDVTRLRGSHKTSSGLTSPKTTGRDLRAARLQKFALVAYPLSPSCCHSPHTPPAKSLFYPPPTIPLLSLSLSLAPLSLSSPLSLSISLSLSRSLSLSCLVPSRPVLARDPLRVRL